MRVNVFQTIGKVFRERRHEKGNGDASGKEDIQIRTKTSQGAYRARFSLLPVSIRILSYHMLLIFAPFSDASSV